MELLSARTTSCVLCVPATQAFPYSLNVKLNRSALTTYYMFSLIKIWNT